MREVLLKTEKLSKSFSNGGTMQHVLKNIDLQLYQGDFTVIMGQESPHCYMLCREWTHLPWVRLHSESRRFQS